MKKIKVDKRLEGKKLFRYIRSLLPGLKNNEIFKIIRKRVVLVNNRKSKSDYVLKENDEIDIFLKGNHFTEKGKKRKFQSVETNLDIIFEDNNLLVVNKPKGLLSHPDSVEYKKNLYEMVRAYLYSKREYSTEDGYSPALCNRLDRNTSGLILVAKTHAILQEITRQLRERIVEKRYLAVCDGKIDKPMLIISRIDSNENIVKSIEPEVLLKKSEEKRIMLKKFHGKQFTMVYPVKFREDCSLVEIDLWTGKKHQIRIHLKQTGHPLLGDKKYFTEGSLLTSRKLHVGSMFLHAFKVKLNNYGEFSAPIPEEFDEFINKMFYYTHH